MKPRRNDKCPCGSGYKYKKCCGKPPTEEQNTMLANLKKMFEIGN
jgi:preprotein translocase subunit SecA